MSKVSILLVRNSLLEISKPPNENTLHLIGQIRSHILSTDAWAAFHFRMKFPTADYSIIRSSFSKLGNFSCWHTVVPPAIVQILLLLSGFRKERICVSRKLYFYKTAILTGESPIELVTICKLHYLFMPYARMVVGEKIYRWRAWQRLLTEAT